MKINVDCYAGYRGEQTPRQFVIGDNTIGVERILDQWLAPEHRYFKLLGDDGALYILRHDTVQWRWELTFFQKLD
ncbi:MAG: hypothetical protein HKM93_04485 [Desulfobacteraceae bacterium]|nr:hypothetical protein [Desulfobacteraceae bacterium]